MKEYNTLALDEYKISKDSIKSVMAQLSTVTASLLGLSIAILNYGAKTDHNNNLFVWYMVLLLMNFILAYTIYQNVQITALQLHIAYLEKKLGHSDIFRWESVIARIWYEGNGFRSQFLNILVAIPPVLLLVMVYVQVGVEYSICSLNFLAPFIVNAVYLLALCLGASAVRKEIYRTSLARSG